MNTIRDWFRERTGDDWFWIGVAAAIVIGAGAELLSPVKARAQELPPQMFQHPQGENHWYPYNCCHDRDCRPVPPESVRITGDGYVFEPNGELVPFSSAKPTPKEGGGMYHVCQYGARLDAKIICFFAPGMGS